MQQVQEVPQAAMELKGRPAANVWQGREAPRAAMELKARYGTFAGRSAQGSRVRRDTQHPPGSLRFAGWLDSPGGR